MASNEPPDDTPSGRPLISSLDEPIDESGAEEVEQRRAARLNQAALPDVAVEALRLKGWGFTVMPLPTNAKSPPPTDWVRAAANNPAVFLKNPGTNNYAILPPPGCFGWDVDKGAPELLDKVEAALGVTRGGTLTTFTPNGQHQFYRWPEDLPRPKGPMFGGIVTRWPAGDEGQGYLVGPGSVVVQENGSLGVYHLFVGDDEDPIRDLPREWAEAALRWKPPRVVKPLGSGPLAEPMPHYELPESVEPGMRYESIRSYTAHLYNRGLSSNEMWPLVQAELAPRFTEKVSITELRERFERAVRDIASRLGEPKALPVVHDLRSVSTAPVASVSATGAESDTPSQEGLVPPLFLPMPKSLEALTALGEAVWLVDGWVPSNGLVWWAGQPKSMKSLAVLQMLGAFVSGEDWMERGVQETGTRIGMYATKEGTPQSMAERLRDVGDRAPSVNWARLRVAYPTAMSFDQNGLDAMSEYLAGVEAEFSVLPPPLSGILVIDPMRDFMLPGWDENEAKTIALVKAWGRALLTAFPWVAIVLVHHLRKSAGNEGGDGLDMSGSGAGYAAGDATVNWWAKREFADDDDDDGETLAQVELRIGGYKVEQRGAGSFRGRWSFNPLTKMIVRERGVRTVPMASGGTRAAAGDRTKSVLDALAALGSVGATVGELHGLTNVPNIQNVRTILYRASAKELCSFVSGRWYARGWSPGVTPDGLLPVDPTAGDFTLEHSADGQTIITPHSAVSEPPDSPDDDEVWVDPLHRLE